MSKKLFLYNHDDPKANKIKLQEKSVTPTKEVQEVVPDSDYVGLSKVIVGEGFIPKGDITLTVNSTYDVSDYERAIVDVPHGVYPEGSLSISANGTYDVELYKKANVNVKPDAGYIDIELDFTNGDMNINPESNKYFSSVHINKPDDLLPENIVKDKNIGGIIGSYETGGIFPSGTLEVTENGTHNVKTYESVNVNVPVPSDYIKPSGTKEITENGIHDVTNFQNVDVSVAEPSGIINITADGEYDVKEYAIANVKIDSSNTTTLKKLLDYTKSCARIFYNNANIVDLTNYIEFGDTSNVESMEYMFFQCSNLETIPLFDTSNVKSMAHAFNNCKKLTTIPDFDTSNVESFENMLYTNSGLMLITEIPHFNTSKVKNFKNMLYNCAFLTELPQFDISSATTLEAMLYGCVKLVEVPAFESGHIPNLRFLFCGCTNLVTVPLVDLKSVTSSGNLTSTFNKCTKLTNLTIRNAKTNLTIGSGTSYGHNLTLESLLNACQECINMNASRTLTIGSANLTKLSEIYVKLTGEAEVDETLPKLPMVQCESTDEGAMTIADYMDLKSWSLA